MGKYIRKTKVSGEVAVMEVTHQSSLGVRTRARALAAAVAEDSSCDYLVLRSRRLEKPLLPLPACKDSAKAGTGPCLRSSSGSGRCSAAEVPPDVEVSFGENVLDAEVRDRHDRETTPCSLIRNPEAIQTPCSSNRRTNSRGTNRRTETFHQNIPTAQEMEEFFYRAEQLQRQIFIERYNFDPVDDHPLPGSLRLLSMPMLLPCNHMYCRSCITNTATNAQDCVVCKAPFSEQDLRAAGHIEAIAHICKNMSSTVNAVVNQGPQVAISDTKTHSDARPDSSNNNLAEKFEQLADIIDKQSPFHVESSATLFGYMNPLENELEEKPHEHKLNAGEKVSEEDEINKFLAPGDTFSPQSSGYQKYSDNDSYDGRSEPTTGQLPATVLFKRAADNETCLMENGFLVESKKQRLNKDKDYMHEKLILNCAFCHTSIATEGSGPMLHYLNGEPMTDEQASQPNVLHVHQKCIEWAPQVYFVDETAMNLEAELSRASKIKCSHCGLKGAALGCYNKSCRRSYHVPCADALSDCRWDYEKFLLLCPTHSSHRLPCDRSTNKTNKKKTSANTILCLSNPIDQPPCTRQFAEAWTASPCVTREWILCGSALSREEKNMLNEFVTLSGASTTSIWNSSITHVLAATDEHGACSRTLKVLMAILGGKWILRVDWLKACMEAGHPVAEEPYEITHDIHGSFDGPRNGRLRASQKAPKLFSSLSFYFNGYFMPNYKKYLETLISAAGGRFLERIEVVPTTLIVYSAEPPQGSDANDLNGVIKKRREEAESFAANTSSRVIPHTWLLDAIASCNLPPIV